MKLKDHDPDQLLVMEIAEVAKVNKAKTRRKETQACEPPPGFDPLRVRKGSGTNPSTPEFQERMAREENIPWMPASDLGLKNKLSYDIIVHYLLINGPFIPWPVSIIYSLLFIF